MKHLIYLLALVVSLFSFSCKKGIDKFTDIINDNIDTTTFIKDKPSSDTCKRSFAYGEVSFCSKKLKKWGWVNKINSVDAYDFDMYLEAKNCDTAKGKYVGNAHVESGIVSVTLNAGYSIKNLHINASKKMFPRDRTGKIMLDSRKFTHVIKNVNATTKQVKIGEKFKGHLIIHALIKEE